MEVSNSCDNLILSHLLQVGEKPQQKIRGCRVLPTRAHVGLFIFVCGGKEAGYVTQTTAPAACAR